MFWYCVQPVADKWCIAFDTQRRSFIYDTEDEAIQAAKGAAERNWDRHRRPSGVKVKRGDAWQEVWLCAAEPPEMRCSPPETTQARPQPRGRRASAQRPR